jgi:transcription antitermination factor NusG
VTEQSDKWCILRTAGGSTLRLAESLRTSGIEAWTPTEVQMRRIPRSRSRRERTVAILPTFVFARARHILDLRALAKATVKAQPDFSVFVYKGGERAVADRDLEPLREVERKAARRTRKVEKPGEADPYPVGTGVRLDTTAFAGMAGVVEKSDRKLTIVCFPNSVASVTIPTSILHANDA